MTLELVPWRGATVPVLSGEIVRSTTRDYINWLTSNYRYGMVTPPAPITTYGTRPAEPISYSFEGFVQGMLYADGPVAAAEAYRLRVFGQAPLLYQELKEGRPGDFFDDEALDKLRAPWAGATLSDLMKRTLVYGDFAGNAFVLDLDDELVLVRPDWIEIVLAKRQHRSGQVGWKQVGIVYYEGGLRTNDGVPFLPGEYAHFVPGLPDPLATYRGMSWLTPLIREVQADKSASDHKVAFFENAASPNLAVSLPKEVTPTQFNEFVELMDSKHRGALNAYKTLYTGGGADVTVIGANMQQMDFSSVQGKGEPLALDTPIPTPTGWTTMGDLQPGDQVLGRNGLPANVVAVGPVHVGRDCFRVTVKDGTSVVADGSHLWAAADRGTNSRAERIYTTLEMYQTGRRYAVPAAPVVTLPEVDLLVDPYVLGAWLGDGQTAGAAICGATEDLKYIAAEIESRGYVTTTWSTAENKVDVIGLPGGLLAALKAIGVLGDKHIPQVYLRSAVAQRLDLLRGLMDTDGWVDDYARGQCEFSSKDEHLARQVAELLRSLGYRATLSAKADARSRTGYQWRIRFRVAADRIPFLLPRKVDRCVASGDQHFTNRRSIIAIEPVASVPVRCITVDTDDHLFLAGDGFIPTHNTRIANAAGVPPVLLSFSEGMQGSSLNAGNYTAAKRNFVDTTMRDLWQNIAGSIQQMDRFHSPRPKSRLWYDGRDIPFLHEDAKDTADIQQTRASTVSSLITAGFKPETCVTAVARDDITLLEHTGLTSVQLMPPGSTGEPGGDASDGLPDDVPAEPIDFGALRADLGDDDDIERAFDPNQLRIGAGKHGGGRWTRMSDFATALLRDWAKGEGADDPLGEHDFSSTQLQSILRDLRKAHADDPARVKRLTPPRARAGMTERQKVDALKTVLYKDVQAHVKGNRDSDVGPRQAKFTLQGRPPFDTRVGTAKHGDNAMAAAPAGLDRATTGLTDSQVQAIREYRSIRGYRRINGSLRSGEDVSDEIRALDDAMASSRLTDDVVVYRGIRNGPDVFGGAFDGDLTNAQFGDLAYVSTGKTADQAAAIARHGFGSENDPRDPLVMRILAPRGTGAIEASDTEMLLDRGLQFRVVADRGVLDGARHLDVEILPAGKATSAPSMSLHDKDVAVYRDPDGKPALFFEDEHGNRGGLVEKFDSLDELHAWARDNGETRLAEWADKERGGKAVAGVDLNAMAAKLGGRDAFADGDRNYLDDARRELAAGRSPGEVADRLNEWEDAVAMAGPYDSEGHLPAEREDLARRLNSFALKLRRADPKTQEREAANTAARRRFDEIEKAAGTSFHWGTTRGESASTDAKNRWLRGENSDEIASDLRRQATELDRLGREGRLTHDETDMTGVLQHDQSARDRSAINDAKGLNRLADAISAAGPLNPPAKRTPRKATPKPTPDAPDLDSLRQLGDPSGKSFMSQLTPQERRTVRESGLPEDHPLRKTLADLNNADSEERALEILRDVHDDDVKQIARELGIKLPSGSTPERRKEFTAKFVTGGADANELSGPEPLDLAPLRQLGDPEAIRDALDLRKVDELKAMLGAEGLAKSGRKRELVDRLVGHLGGGTADVRKVAPLKAAPSSGAITKDRALATLDAIQADLADIPEAHVSAMGAKSPSQVITDLRARVSSGDLAPKDLLDPLGRMTVRHSVRDNDPIGLSVATHAQALRASAVSAPNAPDVEQAARDRQVKLDRVRSVAESLAEVDELASSQATPRALQSRIRSRAKANGLPDATRDELLSVATPDRARASHLRTTEPPVGSSSTNIVPTPTPANPQSPWGKVRDRPRMTWSSPHGRPGALDQVDRVYTAPTREDARKFLDSMGDGRLQEVADSVEDIIDLRGLTVGRDRETIIDRLVDGIREPEAPETTAAVPGPAAPRTVADLRALAKQMGVEIPAGAKKADMLALLGLAARAEDIGDEDDILRADDPDDEADEGR